MKQHRKRPRKQKTKEPHSVKQYFAQPPEQFYEAPELELRGGKVLTQGCRNVLDFTQERISLDFGATVITFYGDALRIESLAGKRLIVAGNIRKIEFVNKWEGAS